MRLDELTGTHKYKSTFHIGTWLMDFQKAGGEFLGAGKYATVIGHPKWDHVFKFFYADEPYMDFVRWAMANPNKHVPTFLGRPKVCTPFWTRDTHQDTIFVIKMERLLPWNPGREFDLQRHLEGSREYFDIIGDDDKEIAYLDRQTGGYGADEIEHTRAWKNANDWMQRYREAWAKWPGLQDLCRYFWEHLLEAPIEASMDLHVQNVMQREDGTLVFTDPYWYGENPYQLHDRLMRAETGAWEEEDEERETIPGRERYKPKPKPAPYVHQPWSEDIPF